MQGAGGRCSGAAAVEAGLLLQALHDRVEVQSAQRKHARALISVLHVGGIGRPPGALERRGRPCEAAVTVPTWDPDT